MTHQLNKQIIQYKRKIRKPLNAQRWTGFVSDGEIKGETLTIFPTKPLIDILSNKSEDKGAIICSHDLNICGMLYFCLKITWHILAANTNL